MPVRSSAAFLLITACSLSGCATLMHGSTQAVNVQTTPPGATCDLVTVGNEAQGVRITAPGVAVLPRAESYAVTCIKDGYAPGQATITSEMSGWIWGNIFTGIITGLVTDIISGGSRNLSPDLVTLTLTPRADAAARP